MIRLEAIAFALLSVCLAAGGIARAESVSEPATGHAFDSATTIGGRGYVLLGAGARKKFMVKVYAMALYVDDAEARHAFPALVSRAGGRDHAKLTSGDHAQSFVMWGTFGKLAVMHFVRDVEAAKIRGAFEEGLQDVLDDKAPADLKQAAQQFLALFDHDMKEGQEIVLSTSAEGKIEVKLPGDNKAGPQSPRLARAVWGIWLGDKPISADLRRTLVERIDVLGKP